MPWFTGRRGDYSCWVVYRLFRDEVLVYVGMSGAWQSRLLAHSHIKGWNRYEVERYRSRKAALAAESKAIRDEQPLLNTPPRALRDQHERELRAQARERELKAEETRRAEAARRREQESIIREQHYLRDSIPWLEKDNERRQAEIDQLGADLQHKRALLRTRIEQLAQHVARHGDLSAEARNRTATEVEAVAVPEEVSGGARQASGKV